MYFFFQILYCRVCGVLDIFNIDKVIRMRLLNSSFLRFTSFTNSFSNFLSCSTLTDLNIKSGTMAVGCTLRFAEPYYQKRVSHWLLSICKCRTIIFFKLHLQQTENRTSFVSQIIWRHNNIHDVKLVHTSGFRPLRKRRVKGAGKEKADVWTSGNTVLYAENIELEFREHCRY